MSQWRNRPAVNIGGVKMETTAIALQIMQLACERQKQTGLKVFKPKDLLSELPSFSAADISAALQYLHEQQHINAKFLKNQQLPLAFILQPTGIDWTLSQIKTVPELQQPELLPPPNGLLDFSKFTLLQPFDHADFLKLIKKNTPDDSQDRLEISKMQFQMENMTNYNIPIAKSSFINYHAYLKKHAWLTEKLAEFLVKWAGN